MHITALGDLAWRLTVGNEVGDATLARVLAVAKAIREAQLGGVREVVAAFTTVVVHVEPAADASRVRERVLEVLAGGVAEGGGAVPGRERVIEVVYGGTDGPDIELVAAARGLTPAEVIRLHTGAAYRVHAIGFAPGFPYLAGLAEALHTPRRDTPRTRVPAGSVGIGGAQTGVYPSAGPGGWQLIGRTAQRLFDPHQQPPAWLQTGDTVRFVEASGPPMPGTATVLNGNGGPAAVDAPESAAAVEVLHAGVGCSVQDGGRWGWQSQGVSVGGAVDAISFQVANLAVGNPPDAAVLEWTLRGPKLLFSDERWVVLTGATARGVTNGERRRLRAGEVLDVGGELLSGCRGYIAISGGLDVPETLGSRSTDTRAGWGGREGRNLKRGDRLPLGEAPGAAENETRRGWRVSPSLACLGATRDEELLIHVVVGPDAESFSALDWTVFTGSSFGVSPRSNRMGIRLQGGQLAGARGPDLVSAPVAAGAVQVPPDGRPIILLADCQTIGGYPQIAYVIAADLPRLAQAAPGAKLRFRLVDLPEAERRRRIQSRELAQLALGVREAERGRR